MQQFALSLHSLKQKRQADVAQLVEHDLAKVGVTSSSLVIRSKRCEKFTPFFIFAKRKRQPPAPQPSPGGGMVDTQDLKSCGQ